MKKVRSKFVKLVTVLLAALLVFGGIGSVSAASVDKSEEQKEASVGLNDPSVTIDYDNLLIIKADGTMLNFDDIEGMKMYVDSLEKPQKGIVQPYVYGETIVGTQYKYFEFTGYSKYTQEWTKASAYTLSSSSSETFSHKISTDWGDTTVSYSYSAGVSRTLSADPNRWSRLGGFADLKIVRYKLTQPNIGTHYYSEVTVLNKYMAVKYQ